MNELLLKISLLSSGTVLLDGKPIDLEHLEEALKQAKSKSAVVWYYRETSTVRPPGQSATIMNLLIGNKLPIRLSRKPDFSDSADTKRMPHPSVSAASGSQGVADGPARMPKARENIEEIFANVRKAAAGEKGPRGLVVVRPDRSYIVLPALSATPALSTSAAEMERLLPSARKRNVAVIGDTGFAQKEAGTPASAPGIVDANRSIPFFGILMVLSYVGHATWVFEGHTSALAAGCRDADVLIVDGVMLPFLHEGWADAASAVMRNGNILVHDRKTYKLVAVRKVGQSGVLEFPN